MIEVRFEILKNGRKKKLFVGVIVLLVLTLTLVFIPSKAKYKTTQSIPLLRGKISYKPYDFKILAMYQENDSGEYEEINVMPTSGYVINEEKSYCTLDNVNKELLLTAAVYASGFNNHYDLKEMSKYLNYLHIMTYGMGSKKYASHNSPLYPSEDTKYSISTAVEEVLNNGFSKNQVIIGIPFYARGGIIGNVDKILGKTPEFLEETIYRSLLVKQAVVENDPYEKGERALLNFGHTLGHAVEKLMNFSLLHGECVSLGIVTACFLSVQLGHITKKEYEEVRNTLEAFHLPVSLPKDALDIEEVVFATKNDKKMDSGKIKFILLETLGNAYINKELTDEQLTLAVREILLAE